MLNLLFIFFSIALSASEDDSLYSGKISKIQDFAEFDLSTLRGQKTLWYFFQPDCESCRKQSLELSCLPSDLQILAVGVLGSESALKKEFRHHQTRALALQGGELWQKKLKIQQTPTILGVDAQGRVAWRKEHKLNCATLRQLLTDI